MARKPNTSNSSDTVNKLRELEQRFKQRLDLPSAPEVDILSEIGGRHQEIDKLVAAPNQIIGQTAQNISAHQSEIEELYRALRPIEQRREQMAQKSYISGVTTAMRGANLSSDVNAMAGSARTMSMATQMMGMPTHALEAQYGSAMNSVASRSGSIVDAVRNDPTAGVPKGLLGGLESNISQAAQAQAAITLQRRMGMDINSRFINSRDSASKIGEYLESKDLSQKVREGKMGNRADVEGSLRSDLNQIERFHGAQEKYSGDPDKFERFQKAIDKLTESAGKAANTLREMDRQGVGGGGSFLSNPKVQAGLQIVQAGAGLVRDVADMWTFNNPLRERQNQSGFAGLANKQFDDSMGALGGDMSALRRLGGTYRDASEANKMGKSGSKVSSLFGGIGGLAGVGIGAGVGLAAAAAAGTGVGIPIALGILGAAAVVNHVAGNWNQQAGERGLALSEAEIKRQDAISKIGDQAAQSYRDYATNTGTATVGMGSLRNAGFTQMNSPAMLQRMASVGIDPTQAAQLTGLGVQQMGREFNPNQIERAGQLRQAGMMNEQQYFQTMGQMSMVGGNADKNMEELLKNAVANGMDSAKSIAQMVQATTGLAARSAAAGIDVAAGSGRVVGRMMDAMEESGIPMNMRGAVAQNTGQFLQGTLGDTGTNLYTMGRWASTKRSFPNASRAQMEYLSQMGAEDVAELQGPNGEDFAKRRGIENLVSGKDGKIDAGKVKNLQRGQREQTINRLLGPGLSEEARTGLLKADSYEEFKSMAAKGDISEQALRDIKARASTMKVNEESLFAAVERTGARAGTIPTATGGGAGEIDKQRQIKAEGDVKMIEQGRDIIDALGGLKGLTDALGQVAKNFNPKEMAQGVKEAADKFSVPTKEFGDAVDKFRDAVSDLSGTKR